MKKWMLMVIFVLLLSACSEEVQPTAQSEEKDEPKATEQQADQEQEGTEKDEESDEDVQPADAEEDSEELAEEEAVVEAVYELNEANWTLEPVSDEYNSQVVLLTIDDAPDTYSVEMAKTLKELGAPAIFFVNGHFLDTEEEKAMLKEIHDMGFAIGNHTYSHQKLDDVPEETQRDEIIALSDLIEEVIGERPKFFRAPHGVNTDFAKQLVKEEGMLLMNWTYGYDYFKPYMDADKLTQAMVTGEGPEVDVPYSLLKPGANLLMHDREWTAAALSDIVTGLRDKGYEMLDPEKIITP
ncbi:polysaccharide deacetylase family protein [Thalassobacillus hwangdonensis]|uniref:Polysaccharide deacetylase family protein n=1 Tax=Thalassobacillus hwangdonensis TaxID=546108 RepID=A0ABW3KWJ0_9BACI